MIEGVPELSTVVASVRVVVARRGDRGALFVGVEDDPRPSLPLGEDGEPQIVLCGQPASHCALAARFPSTVPAGMRHVRLYDDEAEFDAIVSHDAWLLTLPRPRIDETGLVRGVLVWHDLSGTEWLRRPLGSLPAFQYRRIGPERAEIRLPPRRARRSG
jgi:hypothetical protein